MKYNRRKCPKKTDEFVQFETDVDSSSIRGSSALYLEAIRFAAV